MPKGRKPVAKRIKLADAIAYDPLTGVMTWRISLSNRPAGSLVGGRINNRGYLRVAWRGKLYTQHRVAWFLVYKRWPKHEIDHINGERADNRLANLREATAGENKRNHRQQAGCSGYIGVWPRTKASGFMACIQINGKKKYLGRFDTAEQAARARDVWAKRLHGAFAVLNFP